MKVSLGGKVAIITGGAGGIGKVCAKLMLENAATVILADINKEEGERVKKELSCLGKCEFIKTDVSKKESVSHLVNDSSVYWGAHTPFGGCGGKRSGYGRKSKGDSSKS